MSANQSAESHIVEVLEAAGKPVARERLQARADLSPEQFDDALAQLRGQEVVRKLPETDAYRLTYWPDSPECIICDETITNEDYYELELNSHGTSTEQDLSGLLHPNCTRKLFDEISVSEE
jgi:hypothetical protein